MLSTSGYLSTLACIRSTVLDTSKLLFMDFMHAKQRLLAKKYKQIIIYLNAALLSIETELVAR